MTFEPQFQKTALERQDEHFPGIHVRGESNKLPDHETRMQAHEARIHREFFAKKGCQCDLCRAFTPKAG